jgi:hypothetical protein
VSPKGNRQNLLALKHALGLFGLNVSEKAVQGSKAMVSRSGRRMPFLFQVVQERFHQGNVDLFKAQSLQGNSLDVAAKA